MKMRIRILVILLLMTIASSGCFYTRIPDLPAAQISRVSGLKDAFILKLDMPPKVTELSVVKGDYVEDTDAIIRKYMEVRQYIKYINEKQYECR